MNYKCSFDSASFQIDLYLKHIGITGSIRDWFYLVLAYHMKFFFGFLEEPQRKKYEGLKFRLFNTLYNVEVFTLT